MTLEQKNEIYLRRYNAGISLDAIIESIMSGIIPCHYRNTQSLPIDPYSSCNETHEEIVLSYIKENTGHTDTFSIHVSCISPLRKSRSDEIQILRFRVDHWYRHNTQDLVSTLETFYQLSPYEEPLHVIDVIFEILLSSLKHCLVLTVEEVQAIKLNKQQNIVKALNKKSMDYQIFLSRSEAATMKV